ncbi:MAG: diaminopimelate epimerase [Lachnospiraceae bacterium]|nr:diaminopimelate epimerase [Lachnospiraceae bacterium]
MKFTKMQGIGNDYVYVNCFEEQVENPGRVARLVSDRHFGIGSDGLILICPSEKADCRMWMFNEDGSEGAMCGNGIRCVGKYTYEHGIVSKTRITVETKGGIKTLDLQVQAGKVESVTVDMGVPELTSELPEPICVDGENLTFTGISVGNPHAVYYRDDVDSLDLEKIGPAFEHHERFPDRVNSEFIRIIDRKHMQMRVWERGSGETWACGTGATASAVASMMLGLVDDTVEVQLRGGCLEIFWDRESGHAFMTGPAVEVFHGEIDLV